jgi:hypothetical protein
MGFSQFKVVSVMHVDIAVGEKARGKSALEKMVKCRNMTQRQRKGELIKICIHLV